MPAKYRPIFAALLAIQEPITVMNVAGELRLSLTAAKRWLQQFDRLKLLIATSRGHFWNDGLIPRSLIGGKK